MIINNKKKINFRLKTKIIGDITNKNKKKKKKRHEKRKFAYLCCKAPITDIALEGSLFSVTSIVNLQSRMARECFETNAASSAASDAYKKHKNRKENEKRKTK